MTQTYTSDVRERSDGILDGLPEGPWTGEPDYVQWVDKESNLDCLVVRNRWGALCGYVGVPPQHPLFQVTYQDIYDQDIDNEILVHGGLTYSDLCQQGGRVCHVPFEGREHNIWWFGFDCSHAFDLVPSFLRDFPDGPIPFEGDVYRDIEYVKGEVTALARQLGKRGTERGR